MLEQPRAFSGPETIVPESASEVHKPSESEQVETNESTAQPAEKQASKIRDFEGVYNIEVTTDLLGGGTRVEAYKQAGGRSIVNLEKSQDKGMSSVGEAIQKAPGVRAEEGISGIGSTSTKLNVGVRGADPRLSSSATVMLDEVPIAPAPYGQPALSLFPISLFSIAVIDTVRGGASVRFGPRTTGGVVNLISNPIPERPTLSIFAQSDHFGDAGLAASYGGTHKKFGVYVEYAPRFGRNFREHSEFQAHGGLIKLTYPLTPKLNLSSTTHIFGEESNLPGGLNEKQYVEDRFQSVRLNDRFVGFRGGTNLKLRWRPKDDHELQTIGFYSHTYRMSVMQGSPVSPDLETRGRLYFRPRTYDVFGVEPRYAVRIRHDRHRLFQDISVGLRGMFEMANSRECSNSVSNENLCLDDLSAGEELSEDAQILLDDDARLAAYSIYLEDKLHLLDSKLILTVGCRFELVKMSRRENLNPDDPSSIVSLFYWEPLPSASLWYNPVEGVALFTGYGRSFGPPGFLQLSAGTSVRRHFVEEVADMVEGGVKVFELAGIYGEVIGWYKLFRNLTDPSSTQVDIIPGAHAYGIENDLSWEPGEVWEAVEGLSFNLGYAWTDSRVTAGLYQGNRLAWYPTHEVWGSVSYEFPWGLALGSDLDYLSRQFTDYANTVEDSSGGTGIIPGYTLLSAYARVRRALTSSLRLEFALGVKNMLNVKYFSRTDDQNRGILAQRPLTVYANLGFSYTFLPSKKQPHSGRRKQRSLARTNPENLASWEAWR